MGYIIQLSLPEHVVQRAKEIASFSKRPVEDVLVGWLEYAAEEVPVELLPDAQVLALVDQQMELYESDELSDLLAQQRERQLSEEGRTRLDELMNTYRRGLVRKAEALRVAVQRGLRPPLEP